MILAIRVGVDNHNGNTRTGWPFNQEWANTNQISGTVTHLLHVGRGLLCFNRLAKCATLMTA